MNSCNYNRGPSVKVSPQQQAKSCCIQPRPRQDEQEGFLTSELSFGPDGQPFLVPGVSGWACQQPLLGQLVSACQQAPEPALSMRAVLRVTLVSSQGLSGSHFWQSPGLLLSAPPS